ncbi:hypothetical protein BSY18_4051 (plasmid) [Blastomonas sp. RAC04]|uniref:hypothetical protein n=1 Tax=Blastomonas sp. RAC04 TaxID=1842535 RepID=UPI00083D215A|nr:hypothetical protein [Blastomonas sp. RAC04]AOF98798.1 hypothetical protein BSY18_4051 [Blastomonas sp. RAC04]
MKDWFPLTSYEFYAYLTSGMVVLAAADRTFMGSTLASHTDWKVAIAVFWVAIAYLVGHIVAIPSSAIFEHLIAKRVLRDPSAVILGLEPQRFREHCFGTVVGAREYEPFPADYRAAIVTKLARALNVTEPNIQADAAFQCAFTPARSIADSATRMDNFLNQYGFCRNVSFANLIAAALLTILAWRTGEQSDAFLAIGAGVLALGLFIRFIKFYAAYTREVYRAFNKAC